MKEWEERWRKGGKQVHTDSSVCHRMRFVSPACSLFMLLALLQLLEIHYSFLLHTCHSLTNWNS